MQRSRSSIILYSILGSGVALAFFGHGVLGAKGKDTFIELVTGSYDKLLGGTMSHATAVGFVNVIGWLDIALALVFAGLVIAAIRGSNIAFSKPAMYLFGWAVLWGFVTALSRFTAELNGKETWDVIERGPNFLLPAGIVYLIYRIRQSEQAKAEPIPIVEMPETNGKSERVLVGTH